MVGGCKWRAGSTVTGTPKQLDNINERFSDVLSAHTLTEFEADWHKRKTDKKSNKKKT